MIPINKNTYKEDIVAANVLACCRLRCFEFAQQRIDLILQRNLGLIVAAPLTQSFPRKPKHLEWIVHQVLNQVVTPSLAYCPNELHTLELIGNTLATRR